MEEFRTNSLIQEVSRKASIGYVIWLLVITLFQIYNEKEKIGQKIQNVMYLFGGDKTVPRNVMLEPTPVLKEIRPLKKCLILNKIKQALPTGEDPTQLMLDTVSGKFQKIFQRKFLPTETINKLKLIQM